MSRDLFVYLEKYLKSKFFADKFPANKLCWKNVRLDYHHSAIPIEISDSDKHHQWILRPLAKVEEDIHPLTKWYLADYL